MSDSSDNEIVPEKTRSKKRHIDESDEEYDEEESRYAKRRKDIGNYILDEAAVDDDDEEDDDYDDENNYDDMIDNPEEVAEAQDAMQYVKYDNRARQSSLNLENEEEIEEHYRQRYEMDRDDEFGSGNAMANTITQQSCLPGVKDSSLWQIRCYDGEEKNTVLKLMHKFNILRMTNRPMNVLSVFSKDSVKGYIYMEAYKETHVKTAAQDLKSIAFGISRIKMINITEMTEVMKVLKAFKKLDRNQYVRVNKGLYRGDLGKVISTDEGQNSVMLQLIPRIDYNQLPRDRNRTNNRKGYNRPVPALFNRKKIAELGLDVTKNGKYYSFRKNDFDDQGFLYKDIKLNQIDVQGVKPDMHEIEKFNENINNVEVAKQVKRGLESVDQLFNISDQVVVVSGSLKELRGKVVSIDNKNIVVHATELKQNMSFRPDELRRIFSVGNRVRVLNGQYEGETGIVVNSDSNTVVVLSDNNINQFKVKPMDLSSATSFSTEAPVSNKFLSGDLIQIDPKTVGVIIQFQKSMMKVLTNMNKEVMLETSSSFSKKNNNKSVTLDGNKQEIRHKDMVDIVSGNCTGKHGEIRHVWKGFVFIYNNQFAENRGLIATRGCHVAKKGSVIMSKPSNGSFNSMPQSPRIHSHKDDHNNNHNNHNNNSKAVFKAPNALRNERKFIGATVRIVKGPLKGKIGIIKDLKLDAATIELHSEFKSVEVSKENFRICNSDGQMVDSTFATPFKSSYTGASSATAAMGGKTPNYGSQTPMYGATTPFNNRYSDAGGRTPQVGSSHTPRLGHSGSDTPRAGAFDPVAATPAHNLYSSSDDLFDSGEGKTPAFMGSSSRHNNSGNSNNDVDEDDSEVGNWYSKINNTPPQSPGHYPQTPTMDPYYAFTPASPGYSSSHENTTGDFYGNLEPLPKEHFVKNVEVFISATDNSMKRAVIQGERNGMVSVKLVDEKRIVNVGMQSVFRKEPESGSNVIYFEPGVFNNSENYGKCLSVENGEAVTKLASGLLKLIPLKDVVPFCSDEL